MLLTKPILTQMFTSVAEIWKSNTDQLSEIDSRFGDGDHGVTIGKIAALINNKVSTWQHESIKDFILSLGSGIMAISGGSAGPLYGTLVEGLAVPLTGEIEIDGDLLKKMLLSCLEEMKSISKARVGDKTMMDALIPAVEAAGSANSNDPAIILKTAAEAAAQGAEASKNMVSKFGRARSYGEQTLGHVDAGALSTSLFFLALYEGIKNKV